ncbi:5E5 antigen [Mus musculus]|uniref:5E5 antigen n=1 Tax=Mus musculus TaxID=10090 RepID=UPI0011AE92B4|nr:5E5 antigen [Mus musculus]
MAPAAPYYPSERGWGTGRRAPLSAGHTCGHVRGVRGEGGPVRASSGKLHSSNEPLAPHPGPGLEAPPEEGQGRYSRKEAGRREQGPSPQVGRLEPAQARLLPAGRPRASRLCRPPRAPCRPRSRGSAQSSHAGRGPALAVPLLGAPAAGRPCASAAASPRARSRPGVAGRGLRLRPPPPHPLGLALLSRRNRGPALRRGSPPPPPPSTAGDPGTALAARRTWGVRSGAWQKSCFGRRCPPRWVPRGPDGEATIAKRARRLREGDRDRCRGSRRPGSKAAAVGNSRKGAAFPRVMRGGASSALSGTRATPARAGWSGWVCIVQLLAVTGLGHCWCFCDRGQLGEHCRDLFVFYWCDLG